MPGGNGTKDGSSPGGEVATPYWQLDSPERLGLWQAASRLPGSIRPVARAIWVASPRGAVALLATQVASGVTGALELIAIRFALEALLAIDPAAPRVAGVLPAVALVAAAMAMRGVFDAGAGLAQARIIPAVRRLAEQRLLDAGLDTDLTAFDDPAFYDRLHRARDRGAVHLEQATSNLVSMIGELFAVAGAASALGILHPVLLPVLALSLLPDGWAMLRATQLGYESFARTVTLDRRARMLSDLAARREPAAEIRACQAQPFLRGEYHPVADALCGEEARAGVAQVRARAAGRAVAAVATGATFVLLGLLLQAGWVAVAVAGTAAVAIRTVRSALSGMIRVGNVLLEQGLYVADYEAFLTEASARRRPAAGRQAPARPRRVELRGVSFRYPGSPPGQLALRDVSLAVQAGQTLALVGENGSGKTTLAKLFAGLYEPTSGQVAWDGVDLRELDPASVADRVVMMFQEPVHWPSSARDNVRAGRHDRDDPGDARLRQAAVDARADELVAALPNGWETLLSKSFRGGHELSAGQWQRLAVARGLFRDGPLLVWDEPTAPLDAKAEYAVYESLRRLAGGRTVILITHRLASVRNADLICLLHDGALVEQGTHAELLATGGRYAELYRLQLQMHGPVAEEAAWSSPGPI